MQALQRSLKIPEKIPQPQGRGRYKQITAAAEEHLGSGSRKLCDAPGQRGREHQQRSAVPGCGAQAESGCAGC